MPLLPTSTAPRGNTSERIRAKRKLIVVQLPVLGEISNRKSIEEELKSQLKETYKSIRKKIYDKIKPPFWAPMKEREFYVYLQGETEKTISRAKDIVNKTKSEATLYGITEERCIDKGNYRSALAVYLMSKGGILMPTDDKKAKKEYLALLSSKKKDINKILEVTERRASSIANIINSSLSEGKTGVLIIDPIICVEKYLDSSIKIIYY